MHPPRGLTCSAAFTGSLDELGQEWVQAEEGLAVALLQLGAEQPLCLLAQEG
jgi:hypothetical protein